MVDLNDSKINVLLLAAGLGTRLRPLTDHTPKCLVPIGGRPILKVWIDKLSRMNRVKILINTHHLSTKVEQYVNSIKSGYSNDIYTVYEPELLGTAGTIIANEHFFDSELNVVIHADNATDFDLQLLLDAHRRRPKRCLLTMVTFNTEEPSSCGIVEIDTNQILVNFHEKKADPPGNRANAAIYAFDRAFVDYLLSIKTRPFDLSLDVIPNLLGKIFTLHTENRIIDIGSPVRLEEAQSFWETK